MTSASETLPDLHQDSESTTVGEWHTWAEEELGGAGLGDARLDARATEMLASFMAAPQASIPRACGGWAEAKAAYRFFHGVTPRLPFRNILT